MKLVQDKSLLKLISVFFRGNNLVHQQINSFNKFIEEETQSVINKTPKLVIESHYKTNKSIIKKSINSTAFFLIFKQIYFSKPIFREISGDFYTIFPNIARARSLTYASDVFLDMESESYENRYNNVKKYKIRKKAFPKKWIGKIPSLLGSKSCNLFGYNQELRTVSGECPYDEGGYFLINGNERVLVSQERLIKNKVYIFKKLLKNAIRFSAHCRSQDNTLYNQGQMIYVTIHLNKEKINNTIWSGIHIKLSSFRAEIPAIIMLRALGFENDKQIVKCITHGLSDAYQNNILYESFNEAKNFLSNQQCLEFIGKRTFLRNLKKKTDFILIAKDIINKKILPHMGTTENSKIRKSYFICFIIRKIFNVILNRDIEDDKDSFKNKRIDLSGALMSSLFNNLFRRFIKETKSKLLMWVKSSSSVSLDLLIKPNIISNGFHYALATGNWVNEGMLDHKTGVSQLLNRMSYLSMLSHLSRVNAAYSVSGKVLDIRRVHFSYWGLICPIETPEGQTCGIVKNFSQFCYVTLGTNLNKELLNLLSSFSKKYYNGITEEEEEKFYLLLNGKLVSYSKSSMFIMKYIIALKSKSYINYEISVSVKTSPHIINIMTDQGRLKRPLLILKRGNFIDSNKNLNNLDLLKDQRSILILLNLRNVFDFFDVDEIENLILNLNSLTVKKYILTSNSYLSFQFVSKELTPIVILGLSSSQIPFLEHNQSPRNTYQSSMGKQAIGINCYSMTTRFDTQLSFLEYNQRPLCFTFQKILIRGQELPTGINSILAVLCFTGYNQEDSLLMNESSIERGLFRTIIYKTFSENESIYQGGIKESIRNKSDNYKSMSKVENDGIIKVETRVIGNDILIGKTIKIEDSTKQGISEISSDLKYPLNSHGVVDRVLITNNEDGYKIVRIKIRSIRNPVVGDKFSSCHGQKGIIGMTFKESILPCTTNSIVPELVMNPHAIPSRMTIGHLLENLKSKVSCLTGKFSDSTAFIDISLEKIYEHLNKFNFDSHGLEYMINPITGSTFENHILIGPIYYQRLKHMVVDKFFSRSRGPLDILTRQPVEGKTREGGLRFGEMERDCVISHGAAGFLKERLIDYSDEFRIHICEKSGLICPANLKSQMFWSTLYTENTKVCQVFIPYACKLLLQELMALCISPRIKF